MKAAKICVMIPSYRDPDVIATVTSLRDNARRRCRFSVFLQDDDIEIESTLRAMADVDLFAVRPEYARGCPFARAVLWQMWNGESWCLSCDAHMRAEPDWDGHLIDQLERAGPKSILSAPVVAPHGVPDGYDGSEPGGYAFFGRPGADVPPDDARRPYVWCPYGFHRFPSFEPIPAHMGCGGFNFFRSDLFEDVQWPAWIKSSDTEEAWFTAACHDAGYSFWHPSGAAIIHTGEFKADGVGNTGFWFDGGNDGSDWARGKARRFFQGHDRQGRGLPKLTDSTCWRSNASPANG